MTDKPDKSHNPSTQALARWESEGGARRGERRPKRPRDSNHRAKRGPHEAASPEAVTAKAEHRFAKADKQRAGVKADLKKEIDREKGRVRRAAKEKT